MNGRHWMKRSTSIWYTVFFRPFRTGRQLALFGFLRKKYQVIGGEVQSMRQGAGFR